MGIPNSNSVSGGNAIGQGEAKNRLIMWSSHRAKSIGAGIKRQAQSQARMTLYEKDNPIRNQKDIRWLRPP